MQSYIVLSVCLLSCILVHANGINISTGYTISTDITPNAKNIFRRSISDESGAEEDELITNFIRNITIIEEELQSEIQDFFGNLSTLLSEDTTRYEEYISSLLPVYLNRTVNFLETYIKLIEDASNNETLQIAIDKFQIPRSIDLIAFGITTLNNLNIYIIHSQSAFATRRETVNQFIDIYKTLRLIRTLDKQHYQKLLNLCRLPNLVEVKEIIDLKRKFIEAISHMIDCINNLGNIEAKNRLNNQTIPFSTTEEMDISNWEIYKNENNETLSHDELYYEIKIFYDAYIGHITIMLGVLIVVGTLENGVLILVFIFNKNMRTLPNFCVINLAIVDIFCLAVNSFIFFTQTKGIFTINNELCKIYDFCETFIIALSIYSVTLSSFQRFLAVTKVRRKDIFNCFFHKKFAPYIQIAFIWIVPAIFAYQYTSLIVYTVNNLGNCEYNISKEYLRIMTIFELLFYCIVPLAIIAVTSIITAYRIRKSIKNIPGEAEGLNTVLKARALSFKVVLALTVVFIVSYFPHFLAKLYITFSFGPDTDIRKLEVLYPYILTLTRVMMYLNSCCNPIALYLMSRNYRKYMNKYITCGLGSRISLQNSAKCGC